MVFKILTATPYKKPNYYHKRQGFIEIYIPDLVINFITNSYPPECGKIVRVSMQFLILGRKLIMSKCK